MKDRKRVAIVGSGPAGLMAASQVSGPGTEVILFEKRKAAGRKLLVAGSSGLNITYDAPEETFAEFYGSAAEWFRKGLREFSSADWREFIASLGLETFLGTSHRYFVEGMKAAELLKKWQGRLAESGVQFRYGHELAGFERSSEGITLRFRDQKPLEVDAACLALGGGSWEPDEKPLRWPEIFRKNGITMHPFQAANVGFKVAWPEAFLKEAEGKPIKNVVLSSSKAKRSGDVVITRYGVEGTPVYFAGIEGRVFLDLKPDLSEARVLARLQQSVGENLSPIRRMKRLLHLSEAAEALVFHLGPKEELKTLPSLAALLKRFPLELLERQPLEEAISSSGGVAWEEVDETLQLRKFPHLYVCGEMLDWHAPTGGFLIQGCVTQGYVAGNAIVNGFGVFPRR